ncbi:hypothetical protein D9613_006162 [Agrocybe pediades]|uniref:Reverse transcriptase zinc-binding domain-containing protein n=1 Tax=Agrocybe pediades TaxID=84607 RepID=A0A8H4VPQ7_9AGAR|nr:hypothetical protein D9613_006162 [Agrocybe pediades]
MRQLPLLFTEQFYHVLAHTPFIHQPSSLCSTQKKYRDFRRFKSEGARPTYRRSYILLLVPQLLSTLRPAPIHTYPGPSCNPLPQITTLPYSTKALKDTHLKTLKQEAAERWQQSGRPERFDRDIDEKYPYDDFRKQQAKLTRAKSSILMQIRTGHLPLNAYLHRFGQHHTSRCSACYQTTRRHKEETLKHYLFECPEYRWERAELDRKMGRNSRDLKALLGSNKSIKALMEYIAATGRLRTQPSENETNPTGDHRRPPPTPESSLETQDNRMSGRTHTRRTRDTSHNNTILCAGPSDQALSGKKAREGVHRDNKDNRQSTTSALQTAFPCRADWGGERYGRAPAVQKGLKGIKLA